MWLISLAWEFLLVVFNTPVHIAYAAGWMLHQLKRESDPGAGSLLYILEIPEIDRTLIGAWLCPQRV